MVTGQSMLEECGANTKNAATVMSCPTVKRMGLKMEETFRLI